MFSPLLQDLCLDDSTLPLVIILYVVLTTHVCLLHTSSLKVASHFKLWLFILLVLGLEILVIVCAVIWNSMFVLLEIIGVALLQTLATMLYVTMWDDVLLAKAVTSDHDAHVDNGGDWIALERQPRSRSRGR